MTTTPNRSNPSRRPLSTWRPCVAMLGMLLLAATASAEPNHAEPYRKVLASVRDNVHVDEWALESRDTDIASDVPWSVHKVTLHGGRQEGVDVVVIDNGRIQITVVPTRGMSVLQVVEGDIRLGWDSPVKEVVHPNFINLKARSGLGWLEGFNEWMVRCGLEYAGHPGTDTFINNVGDEATMELTLHGKIGNIPASEVEVLVDREPPHRIHVRGRVDERAFYGPQLEMWTEISTLPGASSFRIDDTLTNRGAAVQEFQLIYHTNQGPPLLEKGARFIGAVRRVTPFNDHAAEGIAGYDVYPAPTPGFIEQVYCLVPYADAAGRTELMLVDASGDTAVSMAYSVRQLPYLTLWKNALSRANGYVTGIEPGTGFPFNRSVERRFGRVPKLEPGAKRRFTIDYEILRGKSNVDQAARRIANIQQGRPTQIDDQPTPAE